MKKCPTCHEEYGDGATYCEKCGTKLVKYRACPHCGELVSDDAVFCTKCGKSLESNEIVSSEIVQTKKEKVVDDATIAQYRRELASYKSKKISMLVTGLILLVLGITLFIVFTYLLVQNTESDLDFYLSGKYSLYIFLMIVFELMADAGLALLIVQAAVFTKKISNRERAIAEYESRHK